MPSPDRDTAATVLAVDLGSGGVTAACFDSRLTTARSVEQRWQLVPDARGTATLSAAAVLARTAAAIRECAGTGAPPRALVLSSMMHTLVIARPDGTPGTPVLTWLDSATVDDDTGLRQRLGPDYTRRTGAWVHPSFPAYKIARLQHEGHAILTGGHRIRSLPGYILNVWAGADSEDVSTASAAGLLNLATGLWDENTIAALGVDPSALPPLVAPGSLLGGLRAGVAATLGLPSGLPVIAGGGDGFLATLGSGCRSADRLAITVGTTSAVRRFQDHPEDPSGSGLFCYRFASDRFLVGCASNNGGNLLEWARSAFPAEVPLDSEAPSEPPVFIPFVFGERAPFWDNSRMAHWLEVSERHTPEDLGRAVAEAVAFTLAVYCRICSGAVGPPVVGVLSGNGFRLAGLDRVLATLVPFPLIMPTEAGDATLRGAAAVAFKALGVEIVDSMDSVFEGGVPVRALDDRALTARFERFARYYRQ